MSTYWNIITSLMARFGILIPTINIITDQKIGRFGRTSFVEVQKLMLKSPSISVPWDRARYNAFDTPPHSYSSNNNDTASLPYESRYSVLLNVPTGHPFIVSFVAIMINNNPLNIDIN